MVKVVDVCPDACPDPDSNPTNVRPGGYQQLARAEVMRGKFRNGLERPQPFVHGRLTRTKLTLLDVLHTFRKGPRLMVQVQSSWFPLQRAEPMTRVDRGGAGLGAPAPASGGIVN